MKSPYRKSKLNGTARQRIECIFRSGWQPGFVMSPTQWMKAKGRRLPMGAARGES